MSGETSTGMCLQVSILVAAAGTPVYERRETPLARMYEPIGLRNLCGSLGIGMIHGIMLLSVFPLDQPTT